MYTEVTQDVKVDVTPVFLDTESRPQEDHFTWVYKITITNMGSLTVQLMNRYWRIVDSRGAQEEISGPGVVGEQPVLAPGETYSYESGCPLKTPSGIMMGHYEMVNEAGMPFHAKVPAFSLDSPYDVSDYH